MPPRVTVHADNRAGVAETPARSVSYKASRFTVAGSATSPRPRRAPNRHSHQQQGPPHNHLAQGLLLRRNCAEGVHDAHETQRRTEPSLRTRVRKKPGRASSGDHGNMMLNRPGDYACRCGGHRGRFCVPSPGVTKSIFAGRRTFAVCHVFVGTSTKAPGWSSTTLSLVPSSFSR
jgi:hypothetical protein